tara:strand:- start:2072 stop:2320 length:249 start_codon:yes stop_codon:yes gene_type:complete
MDTIKDTTEMFLNGADWLGDSDYAPAKTQLLMLAEELLSQPASGALHSQYGLLYRFLMSQRPEEKVVEEQDLITRILAEAGA